jgi:hypothetical protein
VAALPAEAFVEADAEPAQLRDPSRSLLGQQPDGAGPAETAPRGERVGRVQPRIVVRADGRGDPTLGRVAVRARVRGLRENEHRSTAIGGGERGGESCNTGSDDDHVGLVAFLPHNR